MIDEVFRKNKTNQKIADADERFLKISPLPDGSKVVDAKGSRIAYVADPKDDKDVINKSWAEAYFKKEKDAVTKLSESATAKSAEIDTKANSALNIATSSLNEIKAILNDFKGKQTELNALKTNLEALKSSLEALLTSTGLINDSASSLIQTYSSKKIEGLIGSAKTTLTADIKSKTDSLTNSINTQKQSITALDNKITTTQNNLSSLASNTTTALSKKVDTAAYSAFATGINAALENKANKAAFDAFVTQTINGLNTKANKTDVPSVDSLAETFLKIKDKIDAYTKEESDGKFTQFSHFLSSNAQNGYTKLPNGLIIQWGVDTQVPQGDNTKMTFFPIVFPTACIALTLAHYGAGKEVSAMSYGTPSRTGAIFRHSWPHTPTAVAYIAIGY